MIHIADAYRMVDVIKSANLLESGLVLAKPGACLITFADGQIGLF